jgi:hypothetical protein
VIEQNHEQQTAVKIPDFTCAQNLKHRQLYTENGYAVEKIHPIFFNYDADAMIQKLDQSTVEYGCEYRFIYLYRDPEECIKSFLEYQARNPEWYPDLGHEAVLKNIQDSYTCLLNMARKRKGIMLDYAGFKDNYISTLTRIYESLWGKSPDVRRIAAYAKTATGRDIRLTKVNTRFINTGDKLGQGEFQRILGEHGKTVDVIYKSYNALRRFRKF